VDIHDIKAKHPWEPLLQRWAYPDVKLCNSS
jgi:hypothetical protein